MPVQTVLAAFAADRYSAYCRRHFESMVSLRIAGMGDLVVVSEPALIKEVLTGDPDVLRGGEANARMLAAPVGRASVMVLDGERHLRMRRLLSPPFHGEAIRRYREMVAEAAASEVARWRTGQTLATRPRMQAIALEVVLQAVIGVRDRHRLVRLRSLLGQVARAGLFAFAAEGAFPGLASSALGRRLPWIAARRRADRLIHEEVVEHRADPAGREDILALLIAGAGEDAPLSDEELLALLIAGAGEDAPLSDEELRDQMIALLIAGHESTATALAWCFERLVPPSAGARAPAARALARGRREVPRRRRRGDAEGAACDRPRGTQARRPAAARQLYAARRHDGRRVDQRRPALRRVRRPAGVPTGAFPRAPRRPLHAHPFGGGAHRCIGASFAAMEMKTILRVVLERVQLSAPTRTPERPIRWKRVTTVPSRGGRVRVAALRDS